MAFFGSVSVQCRYISTTYVDFGKRNFRKFLLYGKRGTKAYKEKIQKIEDRELQESRDRGIRSTGVKVENKFRTVPEMIPEIIVPDLKGFELKPYVSYRVPDVVQGEFRPQDLFYAVYSKKIAEDYKNGKLDKNDSSLEPTAAELMTAEAAKNKADSVGNDIFAEKTWIH